MGDVDFGTIEHLTHYQQGSEELVIISCDRSKKCCGLWRADLFRKVSVIHPTQGGAFNKEVFKGTFKHPMLLGADVPITVRFLSAASGEWTAMGDRVPIRISTDGFTITMSDNETVLVGERNGDIIKGETFHHKVGGGGFIVEKVTARRIVAFLPKNVKGHTVMQSHGCGKWKVWNDELQSQIRGLAYRGSKDGQDKLSDLVECASWGSIIEGSDEGDGWVKCEVLTDPSLERQSEGSTSNAKAAFEKTIVQGRHSMAERSELEAVFLQVEAECEAEFASSVSGNDVVLIPGGNTTVKSYSSWLGTSPALGISTSLGAHGNCASRRYQRYQAHHALPRLLGSIPEEAPKEIENMVEVRAVVAS